MKFRKLESLINCDGSTASVEFGNNQINVFKQNDSNDQIEVSVRINQGEIPPEWQLELPRHCESIYWHLCHLIELRY